MGVLAILPRFAVNSVLRIVVASRMMGSLAGLLRRRLPEAIS